MMKATFLPGNQKQYIIGIFKTLNLYEVKTFIVSVPLLLSVKKGSCEYKFQSNWFDPTRNQTTVCSTTGKRSYHSVI